MRNVLFLVDLDNVQAAWASRPRCERDPDQRRDSRGVFRVPAEGGRGWPGPTTPWPTPPLAEAPPVAARWGDDVAGRQGTVVFAANCDTIRHYGVETGPLQVFAQRLCTIFSAQFDGEPELAIVPNVPQAADAALERLLSHAPRASQDIHEIVLVSRDAGLARAIAKLSDSHPIDLDLGDGSPCTYHVYAVVDLRRDAPPALESAVPCPIPTARWAVRVDTPHLAASVSAPTPPQVPAGTTLAELVDKAWKNNGSPVRAELLGQYGLTVNSVRGVGRIPGIAAGAPLGNVETAERISWGTSGDRNCAVETFGASSLGEGAVWVTGTDPWGADVQGDAGTSLPSEALTRLGAAVRPEGWGRVVRGRVADSDLIASSPPPGNSGVPVEVRVDRWKASIHRLPGTLPKFWFMPLFNSDGSGRLHAKSELRGLRGVPEGVFRGLGVIHPGLALTVRADLSGGLTMQSPAPPGQFGTASNAVGARVIVFNGTPGALRDRQEVPGPRRADTFRFHEATLLWGAQAENIRRLPVVVAT